MPFCSIQFMIAKSQILWLKTDWFFPTRFPSAIKLIEQKGMTFDHDFCYSFSFSSSPFFRGKNKRITKVVVKSHAFLLDPKSLQTIKYTKVHWYEVLLIQYIILLILDIERSTNNQVMRGKCHFLFSCVFFQCINSSKISIKFPPYLHQKSAKWDMVLFLCFGADVAH